MAGEKSRQKNRHTERAPNALASRRCWGCVVDRTAGNRLVGRIYNSSGVCSCSRLADTFLCYLCYPVALSQPLPQARGLSFLVNTSSGANA